MTRPDPIVVVGGGIVGTSLAYHLREAERPVVLLERDALGAGTTGESIANFGISYPSPLSMRRYSRDHYRSLIDEGTIGFDRVGGLLVRETEEGIAGIEQVVADLDALGYDSALLDPEDVREFGVDPPADSETLYVPDYGSLDPSEILAHWADAARDRGVEVRTGTAVRDVLVEDGSVVGVETSGETIRTDTVVNAAGPWAPAVNDMAGVSLPLRHNYGPILVLRTDEPVSLPFTYFPDKQYLRGEGERTVLAGRRGADYADARRRDPDHARSVPESFRLDIQELLDSAVPAVGEARVINEWQGMRTITPDHLPIVGGTAVEGFHAACGLSGKGITLAPAIGRDLARVLRGDERTPALERLSPERF